MTKLSATQSSIYIAQGEFAVGDRAEHLISTILGSCVAVCLWDNVNRVGGMNHILLPEGSTTDIQTRSIGAGAMETLINGMLKCGGMKECFEAKVFGGAAIIKGLSDIGERNAEFAFNFLATERIPLTGQSVGGTSARRVQFWPETGRARQKIAATSDVSVAPKPAPKPASDLELF